MTAVTLALEEAGLEGHCCWERLLELYQGLKKKQCTCQWRCIGTDMLVLVLAPPSSIYISKITHYLIPLNLDLLWLVF